MAYAKKKVVNTEAFNAAGIAMANAMKAQRSKRAGKTTALIAGQPGKYGPAKLLRTTGTMSLVRRIHGFVLPPRQRRSAKGTLHR